MRPIHALKFWFGALVFALGLCLAPAPDPNLAPSPYGVVPAVERAMDSAAWAQMPPNKRAAISGGYTPTIYDNFAADNSVLNPNWYTYSGASLRTITDATGAITYAPNNLLYQSADFTNAIWSKLSGGTGVAPVVTGNYGVAPDGTTTAALIAFSLGATPASATSRIYQPPEAVVLGGGINTVWLKSNDAGSHSLYLIGGATGTLITVTTSWQQFYTVAAASSYVQVQFGLSGATGAGGVTTDTSANILAWHPTVSAVTHETTPRPGDQVVTTSAAYYGPAFDYTYGSGAPAIGLRIEEARTNLYLNNTAPATQTVTVANTTTYAISFYGTGSLVGTGACTFTLSGTAGARSSTTCTTATTSLVLTDTSLTSTAYPQVEAGAFATSVIFTGASSAARAADVVAFTGAALSILQSNSYSAIAETNMEGINASNNYIIAATSGNVLPIIIRTNAFTRTQNNAATVLDNSSATMPVGITVRIGVSGSTGSRSLALSGGVVVSDTNALSGGSPSQAYDLGSSAGTLVANGRYTKLALWRQGLPAAMLQRNIVLGAPL